ncbi:MAG: isoprenyl transferase [Alphaproteobacteria bacterium]|nr:MAG: isoprenyl transferase [Alphaproteobacteria bacterium]
MVERPETSGPKAPGPTHVAIIMDGNGRWAKQRNLPRTEGHREGAKAVRRAIEACVDQDIRYLTLYAFSSENWRRPAFEVDALMSLLRLYLERERDALHKEGVRVRIIGERERFAPDIQKAMEQIEVLTRGNQRLHLTIALNYGGRGEIVAAAQHLAGAVAQGRLTLDQIDEQAFSKALFTHDVPDPDLLIRTSGEQRISNFLLWQLAYAEMVFVDTLWPDFGADDLRGAVENFMGRQRRYGGAGE